MTTRIAASYQLCILGYAAGMTLSLFGQVSVGLAFLAASVAAIALFKP